MRLFGLVQARMGSSRLPGKVMKLLAGKPLVGHIFDRLKKVESLSGIVLATTADPRNDPLVFYAESRDVEIVRWPEEDDIVGRLVCAADKTGADAFLKVNADCPMVDVKIMTDLVDGFLQTPNVAFASNVIAASFPLGLGVEMVGTSALRWCNEHLVSPEDREFVISWIKARPDQFTTFSLVNDVDYSDHHLCVDTPEDFALVEEIFETCGKGGQYFGLPEIIGIMSEKKAG